MKIIGGEFPLDFSSNNLSNSYINFYKDSNWFESGRAALFAILLAIPNKSKTIFLPSYICESVCETIRAAKFSFQTFELLSDLCPDLTDLENIIEQESEPVILFVNYFGLLNSTNIAHSIRSRFPKAFIIVDHVQAPFISLAIPEVNAVFTSLRKALPIPGGAPVYAPNLKLTVMPGESGAIAHKIIGMYRKHLILKSETQQSHQFFLDPLHQGEQCFDDKIGAFEAGVEVFELLKHLNFDFVIEQRRKNALFIFSKLKNLCIVSQIDQNTVPLFLPVLVPDHQKLRQNLMAEGLYMPIHWPKPSQITVRSEFVKLLYEQELSLVIDQRYNQLDMERIAELI